MKWVKIWDDNKSACLLPPKDVPVLTMDESGKYRILTLKETHPDSRVLGWWAEQEKSMLDLKEIAYWTPILVPKQDNIVASI